MDDLDFQIIRQLARPQTFQWNVRVSYSEIARALAVDEETVRLRVRKLEEEGIIRGWQIVVNPTVFGRTWVRYDLPPVAEESRAKIESALASMDGAHLIMESYGSRFALIAYQPLGAAMDRQAALLAAIAGGPTQVVPCIVPPVAVSLSALDWRIIQAIRDSPRAPYVELASRLGASERTLRRRVDRMIEGRALVHDVDLDFSRIDGSVASTIHVALQDGAPREAILHILRSLPRDLFHEFEGPRVRASFAAANLPAAEAVRRQIEELAAGRAEVRLEFLLRRVCLREWLDSEIAARAASA